MKIPLFFAIRYLFSKKSRNVINIISGISTLVIAAVAAAMITILSAFNGIDTLVAGLFKNFDADLTISALDGKPFEEMAIPLALIRADPDISATAFSMEEDAILAYGDSKTVVTVKAIDSDYHRVCPLSEAMLEGAFLTFIPGLPEAVIGYGVKMESGIPFDSVRSPTISLYAPIKGRKLKKFRENTFESMPLRVAGIYSINAELDSKFVVIPLEMARELYGLSRESGALEIGLRSGANPEDVKARLIGLLGKDFRVKTRIEKNALVYQTNQTEKWAAFAMLLFILIIAAFNIMASLTMLVIEKRKDISVLMAMGANKMMVRRIFFFEGMLINIIGAVAGIGAGLLLCMAQMKFGIIRLEGSITPYYPVEVKFEDAVLVAVAVIGLAAVSNWFLVRFPLSRYAVTGKA